MFVLSYLCPLTMIFGFGGVELQVDGKPEHRFLPAVLRRDR